MRKLLQNKDLRIWSQRCKHQCMKPIPKILVTAVAAAGIAATAFAQDAPQQQYPPQQQQYPPQQQYPAQQGYPAQQQQYPPPAQQYPQQQYPAQQQYPPSQQYPPQGYPPQGYPSQGYPQQGYPQQGYPPPNYNPPPPVFAPQQLDQVVGPIALYPDPLLAQVLTAATYYNEIPDAAGWARAHSYLKGPALAQAIQQDNLPWDPSVISLLPFPQVLDQMAGNMGWTQELGDAVLANRGAVMDAVQRQRQIAYNYRYLQSNQYERVVYTPGAIEIMPVDPGLIYVPYYNPYLVFARPRNGVFVGGAISFGPGITIGAAFAPWGWGAVRFGWRDHAIFVNNHAWERTWANRGVYVHPYLAPRGGIGTGRMEHHELREYHPAAPRGEQRGGAKRDEHDRR